MTDSSTETRWRDYLAAYGPVTSEERDRLLAGSVAEGVRFSNPKGSGETRQGLIRHIEQFRAQAPGAYFETEKLHSREGEFLAIWSMYNGQGGKVASGYNYVRLAADGHFDYMAGFF